MSFLFLTKSKIQAEILGDHAKIIVRVDPKSRLRKILRQNVDLCSIYSFFCVTILTLFPVGKVSTSKIGLKSGFNHFRSFPIPSREINNLALVLKCYVSGYRCQKWPRVSRRVNSRGPTNLMKQ